jgi:transposase-like protein
MQQRRFTKEFEEAVRLVQTSGRTQREIAGDLGISLSTLVRWISRSRDRGAADPTTTAEGDELPKKFFKSASSTQLIMPPAMTSLRVAKA